MSTYDDNEPRRYAEDVDLDAAGIPDADEIRPRPVNVADYPDDRPRGDSHDHNRREFGARVPESAPRPQDHLPPADEPDLSPVMNEALGILVVPVHYDGMVLEIPADPEDWPIKATRAFEQGKAVTAVESLLSSKDFEKILEKNYRNKQFGELFNELAKAGGFANSGN